MTARTDAHRPSVLITEDYEYIGAFDNQTGSDWARDLRILVNTTSPLDRGTSQCHHCGAWIRYVAVLKHTPTGQHIAVGETCMDNRFDRSTADFQRLRKEAQLDREQQKIRKAIDEFIAANPDLAWMDRNGEIPAEADNSFVRDVTRKLRIYGTLSEKQVAAVRKSIATTIERMAQREQDAIEHPAAPVVEGRIQVTGEVLSTKAQYSDYGMTIKMLVRDDRGFKVWGTIPSQISVEKGSRVQFTATVTKSNDDETFGFFKRPTQGKVL